MGDPGTEQQEAECRSREKNWAGNHRYQAAAVPHPASVAELQDLVRGAAAVQVRGSGHSFNAIADSDGLRTCLDKVPPVLAIDEQALTVTVDGGSSYGALAVALADSGFALGNLASLPHISVAGVGSAP